MKKKKTEREIHEKKNYVKQAKEIWKQVEKLRRKIYLNMLYIRIRVKYT